MSMAHESRSDQKDRSVLEAIAQKAMIDRGLLAAFSGAVDAELDTIQATAAADKGAGGSSDIRDQMALLWASIDNDDSRDLDQLTVAEALPGSDVRVCVAVADVDALLKNGGAIDEHARHNTTSVYTAARIFPMLPEKLSTDLTSLNLDEERLAIVVDMVVGADGALKSSSIYRARVRNRAKLAYNSVAAWLEGGGTVPDAIAAVHGLAENLRLQDHVAQSLKSIRHTHGALSLETTESKPVFDGERILALEVEQKNRAKEIIEDFMIAANGVTARFLSDKGFPSIRRVVRTPKRWDRIVDLAREHGFGLPKEPSSAALDAFLVKQKAADPLRFPDLSLAVIKLLGSGEYVAEKPGDAAPGHFGLAVRDYAHSTAPNRRYADLVTQRLLKAAIAGRASPYGFEELDALARHFTLEEDAAGKVERQVGKSAAALLLASRTGERFDALVTGASEKGTWARLTSIPVDGRIVQGFKGLDVGDSIHVQLVAVDVERGYIDFAKVASL
jgi:VacB/RNase II family 3'-5' exoribonuclease